MASFHLFNGLTPDFGVIEADYDFTASNPLNTFDSTGGYTSFTQAYDLSGKGRHLIVNSKATAPRYSPTDGAVFIAGNLTQFKRYTDVTANVGTILIITDGYTNTSTLNILGTFNVSTSGYLAFGDVGVGLTNETVTYSASGNTSADPISTNTTPNVGFNSYIISPNLRLIYINGVAGNMIQNGTGILATMDLQLGKRISAANYFTGNIKRVIIFRDAIPASRLAELYNVYQ